MIIVGFAQLAVCIAILVWLLKKKTGEPYSKKAVAKFVLFGALSAIVLLAISMVLPFDDGIINLHNPLLTGFVTALITASLLEEGLKYIFFRFSLRNNAEVVNWLDVIIAAVMVAIGFVLAEDLEYLVSGSGNLIRAIVPGHILFQVFMGYYYGKARVTNKAKYHVLSVAVPVLLHTVFDMFIISLMAIVGDPANLKGMNEQDLMSIPYFNYIIPMIICTVVTLFAAFIAIIAALKKIGKWSKNGEKQELLVEAAEAAEETAEEKPESV